MSASTTEALQARLQEGAAAMGLELSAPQLAQLMEFLALLQKWNKVYNLTAVRDPQEMLTHHLLDSLAAVLPLRRHLAQLAQSGAVQGRGVRLLDVGSGGGLPGVVFAICCPELDVSCVDTVGKKAAFIQQEAFDVVSCRAFASLPDFVVWSRSALAAPHGVWLAMKGKHPADEIAALPADVKVFHVEQLTVPGLDAERCIVWMQPV